MRGGYPDEESQNIAVTHPAMRHLLAGLSDQVDAQTSDGPLCKGFVEIGRGSCGRIKRTTIIFNLEQEAVMAKPGPELNIVRSVVIVRMRDNVNDPFLQSQVETEEAFRG